MGSVRVRVRVRLGLGCEVYSKVIPKLGWLVCTICKEIFMRLYLSFLFVCLFVLFCFVFVIFFFFSLLCFRTCGKERNDRTKRALEKTLNVWSQRNVFDKELLKRMKAAFTGQCQS